ncbi:MAG: pyridoxal phosphate-dependent aminotransferase family protein [Bacteroidia bacterium]|nr:MAG: pyridoxal phosphate-dependent aminotransferase family protein [Bacteroidia bacterium]
MIVLNSGIGNYIYSNGKKYSYFAGNNYLGLATHPAVKEAVIKAAEKYGVNVSASRHTTGTADIHIDLEKRLSDFKSKEDTVVFASGYQGNSILLDILKGSYSTVLYDRFAHASILAAIPGDIANVVYYDHCDADHLEALLQSEMASSPLVITDGIFALTGEIAPLDKIYPLVKKHRGILVVDDAHSTGILGATGKGTPEYFNLPDEGDIYQTETMSKALGGYGGFISGSRALTDLIRERSATYQASTALPPPIAAAGIAALKIIRDNPGLRDDVLNLAALLRGEIIRLGFQTTHQNTPIIPVILNSEERARGLSLFLEENGVIAPLMNYPVKVKMHQIRITVSANHTTGQAELLIDLLKQWKIKYGND